MKISNNSKTNLFATRGFQTMSPLFRHKPLFTSHERLCSKDYKIPDTDWVIPKGSIVHVYFPKFTLSQDNFIKPDHFEPENFSPDNFKNKFAFQGFGQGPRACPGRSYHNLTLTKF